MGPNNVEVKKLEALRKYGQKYYDLTIAVNGKEFHTTGMTKVEALDRAKLAVMSGLHIDIGATLYHLV